MVHFPSDPESTESRIALSAIAEFIPLMDPMMSEHAGSLYSLPPSVKSDCDIGKNYHFWMTAYFARKNAVEGMDPKSAAAYGANLLPKDGADLNDVLTKSVKEAPVKSVSKWSRSISTIVDPTYRLRSWADIYKPTEVFKSVVPEEK